MSTAFADELTPTHSSRPTSTASPNAVPFPMILGGQELSEMIQKKLEAIEFGELSRRRRCRPGADRGAQIHLGYYSDYPSPVGGGCLPSHHGAPVQST